MQPNYLELIKGLGGASNKIEKCSDERERLPKKLENSPESRINRLALWKGSHKQKDSARHHEYIKHVLPYDCFYVDR